MRGWGGGRVRWRLGSHVLRYATLINQITHLFEIKVILLLTMYMYMNTCVYVYMCVPVQI